MTGAESVAEADGGASGFARRFRVPIMLVLLATVSITALLVSGTEISVWRDLRRDVVLRDGYAPDTIGGIRFSDSSAFAVWLSSDSFVRESLRRGELPLWDRSQAGGYSPLLNLQNGVLHPLRWVVGLAPREFAPSVLVVGSLLLLCLGMNAMLRVVYGLSEIASLLGALVVTFSGYTMSVVHFSGALIPLIHVPWIVVAFTRWAETHRVRHAVSFSLLLAFLLLAGHPLLIVVAVVLAALLAGWSAIARGRTKELLWGSMLALAGLVLTSVAAIPMIANLPQLWSYKTTTAHGVSYRLLERLDSADAVVAALKYVAWEGDQLDTGPLAFYLGFVATALAVVGFVSALRRRRTRIVPILIVLGWILAVPSHWLVDVVALTPLKYFKPWYLMFLFVVPACVAVAMGFDLLLSKTRARLRSVVIVMVFAAITLQGAGPVRDVLEPSKVLPVNSPALEFLASDDDLFRVVGLEGQTHLPNAGAITGVDDVRFSSPVQPSRFHTWFGAVTASVDGDAFPTSTIIGDANSPILGAFNVKYVIRSTVPGVEVQSFLPRPGERPPGQWKLSEPPDSQRYSSSFEGRSVELYETRDGYHSRAHFADDVRVVSDGMRAAADQMVELQWGKPDTAVVEVAADRVDSLNGVEPATVGDRLEIDYPSSRHVRIDTRTEGKRLVVLHDSWDPGWRATLDGKSIEILPVNVLSRGVIVPPGAHRVEMWFMPRGTVPGAIGSLVGVAMCLMVGRMAGKQLGSR